MKRMSFIIFMLTIMAIFSSVQLFASEMPANKEEIVENGIFPSIPQEALNASRDIQSELSPAIWPFNNKDEAEETFKPKSPRKAFFLSLLLPGLGETYVGSKRGLVFLGVEAFAWWMYLSNTSKGNDIEKEFQSFADQHWHYDDITDANQYNYWEYLQNKYSIPDSIGSRDYSGIDDFIEGKTSTGSSGGSVHNLPSTKTQQYYEMIGKYDQFVFGWEDIDDNDLNPNLETAVNPYDIETQTINSPMRKKYMNMRGDSNKKLESGQRGVQLMMLNRIVSAIDAARLAYHHNQKNKSDLSMVRVRFVQKQILDNKVPMLVISKSF